MSYKNRKRMYDSLVAKGRHNDIDPTLMEEFGQKEKKKEVKEVKKTKKVKKYAK